MEVFTLKYDFANLEPKWQQRWEEAKERMLNDPGDRVPWEGLKAAYPHWEANGYFKELLEQLRVQERHKEIKGCVVVRDDGKECCLLLAKLPQIKLIRYRESCNTFKVELLESCSKCDLNGLKCLG